MAWGSPAFDAGLEHERRVDLGGRPAVLSGAAEGRKPGDSVTFEVKHRGGVTGKGTLTFGGTRPGKPCSTSRPETVDRGAEGISCGWLGSQRR